MINYVLTEYILNSIHLIIGVSLVSLIFGVGSAWLISNYDFLGKSWLEWALVLPLAVPPYILAYTFTGLFDTYGTANELFRIVLRFFTTWSRSWLKIEKVKYAFWEIPDGPDRKCLAAKNREFFRIFLRRLFST